MKDYQYDEPIECEHGVDMQVECLDCMKEAAREKLYCSCGGGGPEKLSHDDSCTSEQRAEEMIDRLKKSALTEVAQGGLVGFTGFQLCERVASIARIIDDHGVPSDAVTMAALISLGGGMAKAANVSIEEACQFIKKVYQE